MKDTLDYWLKDSLVYNIDSLQFLAQYPATDSLGQIITYDDTLKFIYREPQKKSAGRKRKQEDEEDTGEKFTLSAGVSGRQPQDIHRPLVFQVQHPVSSLDETRISLAREEDSLRIPVPYSIEKDTTRLRRYFMNVDWESELKYFLDIYPGAFRDIYGLTHDTVSVGFSTRGEEWYGRILLNLSGIDGPKIIQLFDKDDKIVRVKMITEDGLVEFPYLEPAGFTLKVVHDDNGNGKWDTGSYLEGIQPESVSFHPGTITIRSNFDMEINWNLQEGQEMMSGEISPELPGMEEEGR
jgi:hypothetical protein